MRRLAIFALGFLIGLLLNFLLTQPATSRAPSAPRPAATILATLRPVAPLRTGAPGPTRANVLRDANAAVLTVPQPSLPTGTGPAATEAASDPQPSEATPKPTPRRTTRPPERLRGVASYVRASLGADYLASRLPRGTRLRICGPVGCVTGTVNDYGPSKRIHPERIVDLSAADFTRVCGPLSLGVCRVVVR